MVSPLRQVTIEKRESNQSALAPPLGASPRLGMPERRPKRGGLTADLTFAFTPNSAGSYGGSGTPAKSGRLSGRLALLVIVPTLCVGMPPGTLRVPLTTHDVSRA